MLEVLGAKTDGLGIYFARPVFPFSSLSAPAPSPRLQSPAAHPRVTNLVLLGALGGGAPGREVLGKRPIRDVNRIVSIEGARSGHRRYGRCLRVLKAACHGAASRA